MNIIDSSGWLEYFADGPNAGFFAKTILEKPLKIIMPAIIIYEVFKKILYESGETSALQVIAQMQKYQTENIDVSLALSAAKISHKHKIPIADSMICAVSCRYNALIWTQDKHLKGLTNVKYIKKSEFNQNRVFFTPIPSNSFIFCALRAANPIWQLLKKIYVFFDSRAIFSISGTNFDSSSSEYR